LKRKKSADDQVVIVEATPPLKFRRSSKERTVQTSFKADSKEENPYSKLKKSISTKSFTFKKL